MGKRHGRPPLRIDAAFCLISAAALRSGIGGVAGPSVSLALRALLQQAGRSTADTLEILYVSSSL